MSFRRLPYNGIPNKFLVFFAGADSVMGVGLVSVNIN
jgi:hypothetical protein